MKSNDDQVMYRANILKQVTRDEYLVFYVDFGHQETVTGQNISFIPPDIKAIPAQVSFNRSSQVFNSQS